MHLCLHCLVEVVELGGLVGTRAELRQRLRTADVLRFEHRVREAERAALQRGGMKPEVGRAEPDGPAVGVGAPVQAP